MIDINKQLPKPYETVIIKGIDFECEGYMYPDKSWFENLKVTHWELITHNC